MIWAGVWGDENEQLPLDIDTDAEGNVYVLGAFQGAIKLSDPALISAGGWDLFLTKLDASGAVLWSKQFGNAADQNAGQIAVSAAGDIVVAGKLTGAINFGGGVLQGKDVFVARFSTDGTHVWSEAFQVGAPTQVDVATGPDGAVFLWTDFLGTAAFGGPGLSAPSDRNAVLVGLSADTGAFAWQKPFVSPSQSAGKKDTTIRSIDTDSAGNITASGYFLGSKINLGGSDLLEGFPGGGGSFMGRFDSMGGHAWSVGNVFLGEISADPLGAIAAVSVDDPANRGCNSGFVTRYSTVGSKVWEKTIGCPKQGDDVLSISGASDPFGAVDVAVAVESSSIPFTFGQGVLPSIGTVDLALGKFDSKGDHVWSRRFGVPEEVQASPVIAIAPNGDVVMAAQVSGPIDVGTGPLPSLPGAKDLLIARFGQ
ncbi:MAG: hypothetical protein R3F14_34390 [Polyangiaceae bacterium]